MQAPESIEETLARLMPSALSVSGQEAIEQMFDELMGPEEPEIEEISSQSVTRKSAARRAAIPIGMAAALAALAVISFRNDVQSDQVSIFQKSISTVPAGMVVVGEEDRIENMTDEGWMSDSDGTTMQAVRMRVVQENTVRDEESGMVFQLTEPREEMVLIPVNSF
ncbi:hypothetical protein JIN85_17675 [Luteolibacter pohnpeiensis]|uniref:Uncharacterized protein n=2 Tax=Luteolibacter pohnpeiensis TaxID=454153 RepID=A0A934VY73_9BACT|nr:hypothetical protein [Luteolibacter pohnpeiensis]